MTRGRRLSTVIPLLLASACVGDDGAADGSESDPTASPGEASSEASTSSDPPPGDGTIGGSSSGGEPPPPDEPLAVGIGVTEVEVNQGVGITIIADATPWPPSDFVAPIIGGRPALIRAGYELAEGFPPRAIDAYLELEYLDGATSTFVTNRRVSGPPDFGVLGGTFEWTLAAEDTEDVTGLNVSFHEASGAPPVEGDPLASASVPADGFAELGTWHDPMVLDVMLVPLACDGIDAVEVSDEDLADMEAYLFDTYPIQELVLTVHEPVFSPGCNEFDAAEWELPALRESEGAPPYVYYGGLLPTDVGGYSIAIEGSDQTDYRRTFANGTWRDYGLTFDLFAHELGHNHGRPHTFEDPSYPGVNQGTCGTIDTYGHGLVSGMMPQSGYSNDQEIGIPWVDPSTMLIPPTSADPCEGLPQANQGSFSDMMSYAYPYWVSAYTYHALAERVRTISSWRERSRDSDLVGEILRVVITPEGALHWSRGRGASRVEHPVGQALCHRGRDLVARLPVRRGTAIHDVRLRDGSLRSWAYTTLEVPLTEDLHVERCELYTPEGVYVVSP